MWRNRVNCYCSKKTIGNNHIVTSRLAVRLQKSTTSTWGQGDVLSHVKKKIPFGGYILFRVSFESTETFLDQQFRLTPRIFTFISLEVN